MEPLNKTDRSQAFRKFLGLYLLILAIPLIAAYFLFSNGSLGSENDKLKKTIEEQKKLLARMDTLGNILKRIDDTDKKMATIPKDDDMARAELMKVSEGYKTGIASTLVELRTDSSKLVFNDNKRISRNLIKDFDVFLTYRGTIELLRKTLADKGIDTQEKERLAAELKAALDKNQMLSLMAGAANKASGGGGGGGGGGADKGEVARLNNELMKANEQLGDCRRSSGAVDLLRDQLKFAGADCEKIRADDETGSKAERKQRYASARRTFEELTRTTRNADIKESANQKISQIDAKQ